MGDTSVTSNLLLTGKVKWFNNKAGYGFITVTDDSEYKEKDIFVHHSSIKTENEQYKYLVQGEYVSFQLSNCENHEYQASSVSGVFGDKLMCETRNENRVLRNSKRGNMDASERGHSSRRSQGREKYTRVAVQVRGDGPRENEEWMLVRRNKRGVTGRHDREHSNDSLE